MRNLIIAVFLLSTLTGCAAMLELKEDVITKKTDDTKTEEVKEPDDVVEKPQQDSPDYAPIVPDEKPVQAKVTGSLFNPNYQNNIFSDIKARRVGDIITVKLAESTSAKKKASSSLGKDNSFELDPVSVGGKDVNIQGYTIEGSLKQSSSFAGNGSADQSNSLQGDISVTVVKILPNDNLVIRGEKWLMLNNGNEFIRLTGLLRPKDIGPDNTVKSSQIANARIQYGAVDDLGEAQIQGWATKFLNGSTWPF